MQAMVKGLASKRDLRRLRTGGDHAMVEALRRPACPGCPRDARSGMGRSMAAPMAASGCPGRASAGPPVHATRRRVVCDTVSCAVVCLLRPRARPQQARNTACRRTTACLLRGPPAPPRAAGESSPARLPPGPGTMTRRLSRRRRPPGPARARRLQVGPPPGSVLGPAPGRALAPTHESVARPGGRDRRRRNLNNLTRRSTGPSGACGAGLGPGPITLFNLQLGSEPPYGR